MTFTAGSCPVIDLYVDLYSLRSGKSGFGFQPGYPSVWAGFAPPSSTMEATVCRASIISEATELRWLGVMTTLRFFVLMMATLVDVSTSPGISALILINPCGRAAIV